MSTQRTTRIICAAEPGGSLAALSSLLEIAEQRNVHALAVVGDLGDGSTAGYRELFRTLATAELPSYWVPGPGDAPLAAYLRETQNVEVVHPFLRGVHGTVAMARDRHTAFAGLGGEIVDDPDTPREEIEQLRYPRWEAEYRLKVLQELDEHQLVLLFATPPAHKGLRAPGSEAVAELVATHRPRLVVCGGEARTELLGRSLVVGPGPLSDGRYAIADMQAREAHLEELPAAVR